ncbi:MAG: hypothetical protein ACRCXZ_04590 [Patescibacteria group bacterium]
MHLIQHTAAIPASGQPSPELSRKLTQSKVDIGVAIGFDLIGVTLLSLASKSRKALKR